jgi:hypothetical protein
MSLQQAVAEHWDLPSTEISSLKVSLQQAVAEHWDLPNNEIFQYKDLDSVGTVQ